jgi:hypothetical protein
MFPSQYSHRNIATLAMPLIHPTTYFSSVANVFALDPFDLHNHDGLSPFCCICYHTYGSASRENEAEYPTQLVCGHVFGTKCIRKWARINSTCPLCRAKLIEAKQSFFKIHALQVDADPGLFEAPMAHDLSDGCELSDYSTDGTEYFGSRSAAGSNFDGESNNDGFSWQEDAGSATSSESGDRYFSSPQNTGDDSDDEYFNRRSHMYSDADSESDSVEFFDTQEEFDTAEEVRYLPDEDIWLTARYEQQHAPTTPCFSLLGVEPTSILPDAFFEDLVGYHEQWITETLVCSDRDDEYKVGFYDVYPY